MLISAVCGAIFGIVSKGGLALLYVFNANFLIGSVVTATGVYMLLFPNRISFRRNKLIDHSTFFEKSSENRAERRKKAVEILYTGILMIFFTGTIQLMLWLVI